jgi:hypothetical protein
MYDILLCAPATATGTEHDVKEYPQAGHSFLNDHHDLMFKVLKIARVGSPRPMRALSRRRSAGAEPVQRCGRVPRGTAGCPLAARRWRSGRRHR